MVPSTAFRIGECFASEMRSAHARGSIAFLIKNVVKIIWDHFEKLGNPQISNILFHVPDMYVILFDFTLKVSDLSK